MMVWVKDKPIVNLSPIIRNENDAPKKKLENLHPKKEENWPVTHIENNGDVEESTIKVKCHPYSKVVEY